MIAMVALMAIGIGAMFVACFEGRKLSGGASHAVGRAAIQIMMLRVGVMVTEREEWYVYFGQMRCS